MAHVEDLAGLLVAIAAGDRPVVRASLEAEVLALSRSDGAQSDVKLVIQCSQSTATRAGLRELPDNLANSRRRALDGPADLLITDAGLIGRR